MSYNKYKFETFQEFKSIQKLALANGYKTTEEFHQFLDLNYSDKRK